MAMSLRSPLDLAKKFGASVYASAREFARTHHRACIVYVLDPLDYVPSKGMRGIVRRIEPSPSFRERFGVPRDGEIAGEHPLAELLPVGRKMTRPRTLTYADINGTKHECLGEAFATKFNVFLLIYPIKALDTSSIWVRRAE